MPLKIVTRADGTRTIALRPSAGTAPKPVVSATGNLDAYCRTILAKGLNAYVAWYLIASYLYYIEDKSIISDDLYDEICQHLLKKYLRVTHRHRKLLDLASLKAGTGYAMSVDDYPLQVIGAANQLLTDHPL